jgi:geranylgeranyl transferase type-2 subunit beta
MATSFLAQLDTLLADGWRTLAPALRDPVLDSIRCFAEPNGGFRGRHGVADSYYTDFAVRLLDLAGAAQHEFEPAAEYLCELTPETDLVHLFGRLNALRVLQKHGITVKDSVSVAQVFARQRVGTGGFAQPGRTEPSAYLTFLATLICEISGDAFPAGEEAAASLRALRKPDGGFSDTTGEALAQASTTAAAVAALGLLGAVDVQETAQAALFLASLQTPDGGIRAHREAPGADLLSTFTVLTSLAGLRALDLVQLAPIGRFVLGLRTPEGGFCGSPADSEYDVEYTYYGVGSLCLLQAHLNGKKPS